MPEMGLSRRAFSKLIAGGVGSLSLVGRGGAKAVTATQTTTESWPQLGHDSQNTGHAPDNTGPSAGVVESWHFPTAGQVSSSAAVADGRVVFGTAFGVVALDITDGTREWYFETEHACHRPVVDDGAVYVVDDSDTLRRLHSATGAQQWRFEPPRHGGEITPVPAVADDTAYIADRFQGTVHAVETRTGTERWQSTVDGDVTSNVTVDGETVLFGRQDGTVQALATADGSERWRFQTDDSVRAAPTVDGDTVFLTSEDGHVYALGTESGAQQWRLEIGDADSVPPVVGAETVYAVGDGTLYALDVAAGTEQWSSDAGGDGRPAVADGTVYAHPNDLVALDADTGTEQWRFGMSWSRDTFPVVSDDTVYAANDGGNIYAVAATDGGEQWHRRTGGMGWDDYQAVAVANDTAYVTSYDGNVYAVRLETGTERWAFQTGDAELQSAPAVTGETVIVASDTVYALDAATGAERWRFDSGGSSSASPAVADTTVYVGSVDSSVHALDVESGEQLWVFDAADRPFSSPGVADGSVYAAEDNGNVYAIDAEAGSERWVTDTEREDSASVVVANGRVYVWNDENGISAIDASTGETQWSAEYPVRSPPAVANGTVYFETSTGSFYALDTEDGSEQWQTDTSGPATVVDGAVYTGGGSIDVFDAATGERRWAFDDISRLHKPAVVDGTIYAASWNGRLFALEETVHARISQTSAALPDAPVSFSGAPSVTTGGGISSYEWAFGADRPFDASGASVSHTFDQPGEYTVRLRVTDDAGRTDTASVAIQVPQPPSPADTGRQSASPSPTAQNRSDGGIAIPDTELLSALVGGTVLAGAGLGAYRWATDSGTVDVEQTPVPAADTDDADPSDDADDADPSGDADDSDDSGATTEAASTASVPETPAARFAHDCGAIRSATTRDQSGPVHAYEGVRAEDGQSVRVLALAPDSTGDEVVDVFTTTVDRWAGISHNPHILEVYETGTEPRPWAAVAPGETRLEDVVVELDRAERLRVLDGVFDAVTTANLYNLSHGGLRPAAVQLQTATETRVPVVSDWGLERGVRDAIGETYVTPYTAPEQLSGESTPTTDVYRAGLLAHWLLTGQEPFADATDLVTAIDSGDLSPPSALAALPEQFDAIIATATATDPAERYESVSDLRAAVRSAFN